MTVQEQVTDKIIALVINTGKSGVRSGGRLTAQMLAKAIKKMQETHSKQKGAADKTQSPKAEVGMVPIKSLTARGDTVNSFNLQGTKDEGKAKRSASISAPGSDAKGGEKVGGESTAGAPGSSVKDSGKIESKNALSVNPKDKSLKTFDRIARKYGVSYSVSRDAANPSQFTVFFKAKQADLIMAAQKEFAATVLNAKAQKKSLVKSLQEKAAQIKAIPVQTKNKTHGELVV